MRLEPIDITMIVIGIMIINAIIILYYFTALCLIKNMAQECLKDKRMATK